MTTSAEQPSIPIDSIFHPTDLSEASFVAFVHALKIALLAQSELTILHAANTGGDQVSWKDFPGVRQTLERWGELPKGSPTRTRSRNSACTVEKIAGRGGPNPVKTVTSYLQENPGPARGAFEPGARGYPALSQAVVRRAHRAQDAGDDALRAEPHQRICRWGYRARDAGPES